MADEEESRLLVWHAAAAFVGRSDGHQSKQLGSSWAAGSLAILQTQVGKGSNVCLPAHTIPYPRMAHQGFNMHLT